MLIDKFYLENWINTHTNVKYDLSDTCVNALSLKELFQITNSDFSEIMEKKLNYGFLYGSDKLLKLISALYEKCSIKNLTLTHGGISANQLVLETVINRGDKVLCIEPSYMQMGSLAKFYGANVQSFYMNNDWTIDIERLKDIVSNDTKVICLTNPNNPTGKEIKKLNEIINIADKYGCYVVSDEAYRGLSHKENYITPAVSDIYEKGISTGSMSKTYSLAGIRLGWIKADEKIINNINLNRQYNTISMSALDEYIAEIALLNSDKIIERNKKIIFKNKEVLKQFLIENQKNFSWIEPDSASIACVFYKENMQSDEYCERLYKEQGILVIPAKAFGMDGFFRLGYGMNTDYLESALQLLE